MTHEETVTLHVASAVRSYRDLPLHPLPLPDQGARRAAPARRRAAHARVHHEGRLLLRPRPRGPATPPTSATSSAYDRIFDRCGPGVVPRRVRRRDDGRHGRARVHGAVPGGRERRRAGARLRRQRRGRQRRAAARRAAGGARRAGACTRPGMTTIDAVAGALGVAGRATCSRPSRW